MNKKLKSGLFEAFDPPAPLSKELFLKSFNYPKTRPIDFIISQAGYIRKRIWICSSAIFLIALAFLYLTEDTGMISYRLGAVSSLLPFAVLLTITELARSASCRMNELEMSTRYSLNHIVLCRLCVLGAVNLLLLLLIAFCLSSRLEFGFVRAGIYLLVPYLLAGASSLAACRLLKGREALYCSSTISILLCFFLNISARTCRNIYETYSFYIWIVLFVFLSITVALQIYRLTKNSEEFVWNLYWTA